MGWVIANTLMTSDISLVQQRAVLQNRAGSGVYILPVPHSYKKVSICFVKIRLFTQNAFETEMRSGTIALERSTAIYNKSGWK